ncbi:redoxin domain-containing protein [Paenibacillus chitinolyticus]|uniref:redoxin domain-containing protein n=1 Tax=Paenibacillus chitinolyticus TaxID=79263 RepID=UPI00386A530D
MTSAAQLQEHQRKLARTGYTVVDQVFLPHEVNDICREYEKHWLTLLGQGKIRQKAKRPYESLFPRVRDHHLQNETILRYVLDPRVIEIVETVLGEEGLLVSTSYYYKGPGMRGMPVHQDNSALGAYPQTSLSVWISLDDTSRENGGLCFVPGSHTLDLLSPKVISDSLAFTFSDKGQEVEIPDSGELEYATTRSGDIVLFNGNMIHGSSDNLTRREYRRALLCHFAPKSLERIALNFNNLRDKKGNRVRRRLNTRPKVSENQGSIFSFKEASYYDLTDWKHQNSNSGRPANAPLPAGTAAPDFTLSATGGKPLLSLSDYRGKYVVLFFYPQDHTPHCTKEACAFRDAYGELAADGTTVLLGISPDSLESHEGFAAKFRLSFPLLADENHRVADTYGVYGEDSYRGKTFEAILRTTFIIGPDGVIARVFPEVDVKGHAEEVLTALEVLKTAPNSAGGKL